MKVIRECVDDLENRDDVVAITVSSFGESFVPVDKDGNALTDGLFPADFETENEYEKALDEARDE